MAEYAIIEQCSQHAWLYESGRRTVLSGFRAEDIALAALRHNGIAVRANAFSFPDGKPCPVPLDYTPIAEVNAWCLHHARRDGVEVGVKNTFTRTMTWEVSRYD